VRCGAPDRVPSRQPDLFALYVVEALCDSDPFRSRSWLLRRACDSNLLNGYFAGKVAHGRHLARQEPTFSRWAAAALLAGHLTGAADEDHIVRNIGFPAAERQHMVDQYVSLLNRADWTAIAEAHLQEGDEYSEWIAYATRRVPLNAFTNLPDESEPAPP
jgi:hypothetical protein